MIILAASVVITLSNTGVINRADQAVKVTDEKQIEQLVNMAWADAYAGGKRTEEELKGAVEQVLSENKVDTNKVAINVTEKGVEVSDTVFEVYPLEVPIEKGSIIQLKAKIPVDYEDVYATFETNGTTKTVAECTNTNGIKVFEFNVMSQKMGDLVNATLYATYKGEKIEKSIEGISVESYAKTLLQKTAEELNMSTAKYTALKTLIADFLEYGAMSQIMVGYNTSSLVNAGVTGKSTFVELTETNANNVYTNSTATTYYYGTGLTLEQMPKFRLFFAAEDINTITIKISAEGNVETRIAKDFESAGSGFYQCYSSGILPENYDKVYTIDMYDGETLRKTYLYSVKSYVYSYQNKTESDGTTLTAAANAARAIYNYGLSAKAYLAAE